MMTFNPQFIDQQDVQDVASLLMELNNISTGRDVVWLLNDGQATDNQEAIERWLRAEVWQRLINQERIDLQSLAEALRDRLNTALWEAQS
tara:strand:- start:187 stop:456 length:270 start_codon:yes stop_codon:yes gene_type:complete